MTNKEAIHELEWIKERGFVADKGIIGTDRIVEAVTMAIEALEKQIAMKPTEMKEYEDCIDWLCPKCGRFHRNDFILQYCSNCGQKIGGEEEWK